MHGHSGDHEQPVDDRVEQRPKAAVLTGEPRHEPVQVVGPTNRREQRHRQRVRPWRAEKATIRNAGIAARRAKPIALGSVHGLSG